MIGFLIGRTSPAEGRVAPLLPEAGAAGLPLTLVIAVLAFIASVSLASYFMVSRAVGEWTGDLTGTMTVQIKGATPAQIDIDAGAAIDYLTDQQGVLKAERLSRDDAVELLKPWLGTENLGPEIPVPELITLAVGPEARSRLGQLRTGLKTVAPGASIDDHSAWNDRLAGAARRAEAIALLVFIALVLAAGSIIVFAARAGLAANRATVEVMHLVGATDEFIAAAVQRRYLALGLRGGLFGAVVAAIVLGIAASMESDASGFFLPNLSADPTILLRLIIVPGLLCGVATVTARFTVLNTLRRELPGVG